MICAVEISFGYQLIRRMHGDDRHANIHRINIEICDIFCNCTATAEIYLAKFSRLPNNIVVSKDLSNCANHFSRSIT